MVVNEAGISVPDNPPAYDDIESQRPFLQGDVEHDGAPYRNEDHDRMPSSSRSTQRPARATMAGYEPPREETPRASDESVAFLSTSGSTATSYEDVRAEMEQMEVADGPSHQAPGKPATFRVQLSRRLAHFTTSLSSIGHGLTASWPSFDVVRSQMYRVRVLAPVITVILLALGTYLLLSFATTFPTPYEQLGSAELVRSYVQGHIDGNRIRRVLERITAYDHVAGTQGDYALAKYVRASFQAAQLEEVETKEYQVYLNYPRSSGRRVAIVSPPELAWEASLEEEPAFPDGDPPVVQTLNFHGHSRAGNVTGPLIYANFGSRRDFRRLKEQGIDVAGAIVLVKYYGPEEDRALKVKAAELAGASGCLIYSDPSEDGFTKGDVWPDGRWMPSDGVQRGGVSLMSRVVGDVLTPGYASTADAHRQPKDGNAGLVNIPSLPLAWRDAQKLLQSLKGHGHKVSDDWIGGVPDVEEWWSGDGGSPVVHLKNEQDEEERQPIWNVLGKIRGAEQPNKLVVVGNHRDAWCFGAAGSGSGTAILLEVVQVFSELVELGWRPRRTIVFASWDGEEYNLIGSTEWVEDNMEELRRDAFAYMNVDTAVSGRDFKASASPLFQESLLRALDRTADPTTNETLRSVWDQARRETKGLGAGSDYVAFQDMAGTSSIDISFGGERFPYHSCYDNFEWMARFGDPGFGYHAVLAQIWALLILEVSDRPVLPYDFEAYASAVDLYVRQLEDDIKKLVPSEDDRRRLDLAPLKEAARQFVQNAKQFRSWERTWQESVFGRGVADGADSADGGGNGVTSGIESRELRIRRVSHNTRMANFETHLLDLEHGGGLPGRTQFKHILHAPQLWSGYDAAYFPGVRDALDSVLEAAQDQNQDQNQEDPPGEAQAQDGETPVASETSDNDGSPDDDGATLPKTPQKQRKRIRTKEHEKEHDKKKDDDDKWSPVQKQINKTARILGKASRKLLH